MQASSPSVVQRIISGRVTFAQLMLLVFPFLFIYQNPELREYFDIKPGAKAYHYFLPLFFAAFLLRRRPRQLMPVYALVGIVFCNLLLTRMVSGQLANFILFVCTCIAAANVTDEDDLWFRAGCRIAIGAIVLNMLVHLPQILSSGADNAEARAIYPTLLAAGVNIELSTLVLFLVYVAPQRFLFVTASVFVLYGVFGTRAILIVWLLYVGLLYGAAIKRLLKKYFMRILAVVGIAMFIVGTFFWEQLEFSFLDRILQIGKDPGSIGRLMLYEVAFSSVDCYAFGCGIGSAQEIIKSTRIADFFEDNFHNVYLQLLVEVGIPGLLAYIALLWSAMRRSRARMDVGLFVCAAGIGALSLIQFTGYEIITAYFFGRALHGFRTAGSVNHCVHAQCEPVYGKGV